ncbi:MAG: helix-turn-helix transcriptional regulator [Hydrogenovibrio sp.]|uniref:helix-turn-helix domain-containing protein n=1 Tax=Hydrogenovibrio sp. TaxID=2065821 RepID=UPI00287016F2|nr:helix-turn-helix transcriptional regulator [Hydrogenovibrio sp.]MDR9500120.1 helix-turn-helix transcriptional regulator [Hydrogenovibrio sp.]
MIKCNLSTLMGQKKLKISDVARETGIHRNTITLLYKEEATRVELKVIEQLCKFFDCEVGDFFEIIDDQQN